MKKISTLFFAALLLFSCQSSQNDVQSKDLITTTELTKLIGQKEYSLVYFWTTWCGPCRKTLSETLPVLEQALNSSKAQLIVVAVSKDEEKIRSIISKSVLQSQKFRLAFSGPDMYLTHKLVLKNTLESLFPNNKVWDNSVPVFVLVDKDLNVLVPKISSKFEDAIKALPAGIKREQAGMLAQSGSN